MSKHHGVGFPIVSWGITWGPHAQSGGWAGGPCPRASTLRPDKDPWAVIGDPRHETNASYLYSLHPEAWSEYVGLTRGAGCWRGGAGGVAPHGVNVRTYLEAAFVAGKLGSPDEWDGQPNEQEEDLMNLSSKAWEHLRALQPPRPAPPPDPVPDPDPPPPTPPTDPPGLPERVHELEEGLALLTSRSFNANKRLDSLEQSRLINAGTLDDLQLWRREIDSWKAVLAKNILSELGKRDDRLDEAAAARATLASRIAALERREPGPLPPVPPAPPPGPPGNPPPVSGVPRVSEDPRILAGSLRSEDGPLLAWERWQHGEARPPGSLPGTRALRMGLSESGSQNHPPMQASAYLLEAMATGRGAVGVGARAAIDQFETQRQEGHKVQEAVTGYSAFHYGAAATLAIVGQMATEGGLSWGRELWQQALGWWADELALLNALRTPDGQILHVGARTALHEEPGAPIWGTSPPALVAQMIAPQQGVKPWIRLLAAADGRHTDPACNFGWYKPASVRWAVCLRQVLRAIDLGALPLELLREAAAGRKPRLCESLWVANDYAGMEVVRGGPPQVYLAGWNGGRCRTAMHTDLHGFGRHRAPEDFPVNRPAAAFGPDYPIPSLPELS